jgi:hypothetical protein
MTDDLTPERVRDDLRADPRFTLPRSYVTDLLAAWTRDRARLEAVTEQRDALVPLAQLGDKVVGMGSHCEDELNLGIATVHMSQNFEGDYNEDWSDGPALAPALAALAAIRAERTTTTEGGQGDE